MSATIAVHELPEQLADLLDRAKRGEEIVVVSDRGVPIAKLAPLGSGVDRKWVLGIGRGTFIMSDNFDDPIPEEDWDTPIEPEP